MAKLYFYYAAMNAGKSTTLLQADFNYRERGMATMLYTAGVHDRSGYGVIDSRIGLRAEAGTFGPETPIRAEVEREIKRRQVDCVLVDEAQFLTRAQVLDVTGQLIRSYRVVGVFRDVPANSYAKAKLDCLCHASVEERLAEPLTVEAMDPSLYPCFELAMDLMGPDAQTWFNPAGTVADLAEWVPPTFCYTRATTIYGGSNEIQKNILAKWILGLPTQK
mgnify:CR=1 FL=1